MIAKPNFGCSTKLIYSKVKNFSKSQYKKPNLSFLNKDHILKSKNELEKIAFNLYPILKKMKIYLSKMPNVIFSRMSGSGSSIVAYFDSKKAASIAARTFRGKFKGYWCIVSKTI